MTLGSELIETPATAATGIPRRNSYVTLPAGPVGAPQLEGSYVSLPGPLPGNGSRAQGTYVTVPAAPAAETRISYTRVG